MTKLAFDTAAARQFLSDIFCQADDPDFLIELNWDHLDPADNHWKLNRWDRFSPDQLDSAIDCARKATEAGSRVYFGAGARRLDMRRAERSVNGDVVNWPAVCWDFDDLETATEGLIKAAEIGLDFHIVVQTGAIRNGGEPDLRVQCWCLLDEPCTDLDLVQRTLKRGILVLGSDKSIHDARRVMRLAGSVAYARKDGRVDEATKLRDDLTEVRPRYKIEEILGLLDAANAVEGKEINAERVAELRERITDAGGASNLWRESPSVNTFLNDLTEGAQMNPSLFGLAMAAAHDGHDADTILAHLQLVLNDSEGVATRPERTEQLLNQLPSLVARAIRDAGLGTQAQPYVGAVQEIEQLPVEEEDAPLDAREAMFSRYIWVSEREAPFDTVRRKLLTRLQFNVDRGDVGNPNMTQQCAWAVFTASLPTDHPETPGFRQVAQRLAYRPGSPLLVKGTDGEMVVNTWTKSDIVPAASATDADVEIYTHHVKHVLGEHAEHFFKYMAHLVQKPEIKINHAILVKSVQGLGKGLMMTPVQRALGLHNCKEVGPQDLASDFNGWLVGKKLCLIDEMNTSERRNSMQAMKVYLASPPLTLQINEKHVKQYEIENTVSLIFFSNLAAPVLLETGDRRFYVINSKTKPLPAAHYTALGKWYDDGGVEKVARWLLDHSLEGFDAQGNAPNTLAKEEMTLEGLNATEEWVKNGIEGEIAPFDTDLVCLSDLRARVPKDFQRQGPLKEQTLGGMIERFGAQKVCDTTRLGWTLATINTDRGRLFSLRRHSIYAKMIADGELHRVKSLFKEQYDKAGSTRLRNEFAMR